MSPAQEGFRFQGSVSPQRMKQSEGNHADVREFFHKAASFASLRIREKQASA